MLKLNKHLLPVLAVLLMLVLIPTAFAEDIDDAGAVGVDQSAVDSVSQPIDDVSAENLEQSDGNDEKVSASDESDVLEDDLRVGITFTPTPDAVDNYNGSSKDINVGFSTNSMTNCPEDLLNYYGGIFVFINHNDGSEVQSIKIMSGSINFNNNQYGVYTGSFTFDLSTVYNNLTSGTNILTFGIQESFFNGKRYTHQYNPLTVIVGSGEQSDPNVIYVDGFDGAGGIGSENLPYHSLKNVLSNPSNAGKEIRLLNGTYVFSETINLYTYDFDLTAVGDVTFTSTKTLFKKSREGVVTFNGIEFSAITSSGVAVLTSDVTTGSMGTLNFNNCSFIDNQGTNLIQSSSNINIKGCAFINNHALGGSVYSGGLIRNVYGSPNTNDISYSIFINNQIATIGGVGSPIFVDADNNEIPTVNFAYNFVDNNDELDDSQIAYHARLNKGDYAIITPTAHDMNLGGSQNIIINFTKSDGSALDDYMADLNVTLAPTTNFNAIPITISKNGGKGEYVAIVPANPESVDVKVNNFVLNTFTFVVNGTTNLTNPNLNVTESLAVNVTKNATISISHDGDGAISFVSDDESIAVVDGNGVVSGVSVGNTTITVYLAATDAYLPDIKKVNVTVSLLDPNLTISPESLTIDFGKSVEISVSRDGDGAISFISDNESIAFVNTFAGSYKVYGSSPGNIFITVNVAANGNYAAGSKKINVTVNKINPNLSVENLTIDVDANATFNISSDSDGAIFYDIVDGVDIISIENGVVTGLKGGQAIVNVTVSATDMYNSVSKVANVTVNKISPNLSVKNDTLEVEVNETVKIISTSDANITYTSSNDSIAAVSAEGIVTGVSKGSVIITVSVIETDKYLGESKNITVTVIQLIKTNYTTTPVPNEINYTYGDSLIVLVESEFNSTISKDLGEYYINAVVNGKVAHQVCRANETSFEFDILSIVDKLEIGINNITFEISDLRLIDQTTYNYLAVNASEPLIKTNFTTTPVPAEADYVIGEAFNVYGLTEFNSTFSKALGMFDINLVVNGEAVGTVCSANVSSFKYDLANIADKLLVGINEITFEISKNQLIDTTTFNKLTVNASKPIKTEILINISDIKVNEVAIVNVTLPIDANGTVEVYVDGRKVETKEATGGLNSIPLRGLSAGNHIIEVKYSGDGYYPPQSNVTEVNVDKFASNVNVDSVTVSEEENAILDINVTDGATGVVFVDVAGNKYFGIIENGKATVNVVGLAAGNYTATITYDGDDKFEGNIAAADITIKAVEPTPEVETNITVLVDGKEYNAELVNGTAVVTTEPVPVDNNITVVVDGVSYPVEVVNGTVVVDTNRTDSEMPSSVVVDGVEYPIEYVNGAASVKTNKTEPDNNATIVVDGVAYPVEIINGTATIETNKTEPDNNITVVVDGVSYPAEVINGTAVVTTEPVPADNNITVVVDGVSYPAEVVNGTVVVDTNRTDSEMPSSVVVDGVEYPIEYVNGAASVKTNKTEPDNNATIVVDGVAYPVEIINGTATIDTNKTEPDNNITVVVDGVSYPAEVVNGTAVVTTEPVLVDNNITVVVDGKEYPAQVVNGTATITTEPVEPVKLIATIIESEYKFTRQANDWSAGERGDFFYAVLKDANGNPLANMSCKVAVNGPIYDVVTDAKGRFGVQVNLAAANTYTYALSFLGNDKYGASFNSTKLILTAKKTSITAKAKTYKAKATKTFSVSLKTVKNPYDGKTYLYKGKKITLKINGKTYTAKTNAKGVAKFTIKLTKKGKYAVKIAFAGDKTYKSSSKRVIITIK